ncbi:MAG TPA: arginase family protein [Actinophytocola sp.]|uniref:arginase family protein n=1 Tax=Actinophytocola sp. TaxID=1872138 RepID=UPI002DBCF2BC|nr:arginase family protein [Actinophytocola sp.]HEU5475205.1 arginase family protein [Actinophytocola sp.]
MPTANRILVPYHLDDHLPELDVPPGPYRTVTAELTGDDVWSRMATLFEAVADAVAATERPVVVSGDCTTAVGTMTGLRRAGLDPAVVWFDAHGDVQSLETTTSGYLGGIALRLLCGYRPELVADRLGLRPVPEDRVLLVDARDLDPPEAEFLAGSAIRRATVPGLAASDLPDGPIYLHVDLDVVDSAELPGLRFPAPGGPGQDAVAAAIQRVLDTGRVCAFSVGCCWHPGRGAAAAIGDPLGTALTAWP